MSKYCSILRSGSIALSSACVLAAGALLNNPVQAFQFNGENWFGNWDNTLSYGIASRVQGRDKAILGLASTTLPNGDQPPGSLGGTAYSVNGDDGNLNYDKGVFSNGFRLTSELELCFS